MALSGQVCLVTGATRGIGKGIAKQLGQTQATVYITGRTLEVECGKSGSLKETAKEIESHGGRCIPVQCDHSKDEDVDKLFERISKEQDGRLDVLVNNAYSAIDFLSVAVEKKQAFWEQSTEAWDIVNNVGLRNHYRCTVLASRLMVARRSGLIVTTSSAGGLLYLFNVAYGVGKAACDRMTVDCAIELRRHNVTCVSLWPGAVRTETVVNQGGGSGNRSTEELQRYFTEGAESMEYPGKAVVALASDKNVIRKTGKVLITADIGDEYGFVDIDGGRPWNIRRLWVALYMTGWRKLSNFVPNFIKVPRTLLALPSKKF